MRLTFQDAGVALVGAGLGVFGAWGVWDVADGLFGIRHPEYSLHPTPDVFLFLLGLWGGPGYLVAGAWAGRLAGRARGWRTWGWIALAVLLGGLGLWIVGVIGWSWLDYGEAPGLSDIRSFSAPAALVGGLWMLSALWGRVSRR